MATYHNPSTIAGPFGAYSQYSDVREARRVVHVAGQVGVRPDGSVPDDIDTQAMIAFANLRCAIEDAGMAIEDITRLGVFMLDRASIAAYRTARQAALGERKPPATLLIVSGLASPAWKIEIEAFLAR